MVLHHGPTSHTSYRVLREEERPVVFRTVLAEPALFDPEDRPPEGLQRLAFPHPLSFDPRELRRLSAAADPQRTLIGVRKDGEGSLRIWGLVNSGSRWLRDVQGGPGRRCRRRRSSASTRRGA